MSQPNQTHLFGEDTLPFNLFSEEATDPQPATDAAWARREREQRQEKITYANSKEENSR